MLGVSSTATPATFGPFERLSPCVRPASLCTPSAPACTAASFCLSEVAPLPHTHIRWMPSCVVARVPQAVCTYFFVCFGSVVPGARIMCREVAPS
mmetsp:Transcript_12963/g.33087  ORF Transcript_12963/g.33087 Transcript_12963/m.33087 type:complete len:95 (-) Transcript_12963:343-627(-)